METMNNNVYGKVQGKKALVLYATVTQFSRIVSERFVKVLEHYGFEVDYVRVNDCKTTYPITDYDLLVTGTGIIHGLPEKNLLSGLGAGNYSDLKVIGKIGGTDEQPQWGRSGKLKKAVVFATYGGTRRGPSQCTCAIAMLEQMVNEMGFQVVGKFGCGCYDSSRWRSHNMLDDLIADLKINHETAWQMLEEYIVNPESEYIKSLNLSPKMIERLEQAKNSQQEVDQKYVGTPVSWHNRRLARPRERDLEKAEIFMAEIVEDMFLPKEKETIDVTHICIS